MNTRDAMNKRFRETDSMYRTVSRQGLKIEKLSSSVLDVVDPAQSSVPEIIRS